MAVCLEFRVVLFNLWLVVYGSNVTNKGLPVCSNNSAISGNDLIALTLNVASSVFEQPQPVIDCASVMLTIQNGDIFTEYEFNYTLKCDEYHTLPLGSVADWTCKAQSSDAGGVVSTLNDDDPNYKYGAYECVEKQWPHAIYLKQTVHIHNTASCEFDKVEHANEFGISLHSEATITSYGVIFLLEFVPEDTNCLPNFDKMNVFTEWVTTLMYRLVHTTTYQSYPDYIVEDARCQLKKEIDTILSAVYFRGNKVNYYFGDSSKLLYAGICNEGWMIDKEFRAGFKNDVPLCRACQRGYYLDEDKGACVQCGQYQYNGQHGATKCDFCHNVYSEPLDANRDSILDCFAWAKEKKWTALNRGLLFVVLFHLVYLAIITWNVRWKIRMRLTKSASSDATTDGRQGTAVRPSHSSV